MLIDEVRERVRLNQLRLRHEGDEWREGGDTRHLHHRCEDEVRLQPRVATALPRVENAGKNSKRLHQCGNRVIWTGGTRNILPTLPRELVERAQCGADGAYWEDGPPLRIVTFPDGRTATTPSPHTTDADSFIMRTFLASHPRRLCGDAAAAPRQRTLGRF